MFVDGKLLRKFHPCRGSLKYFHRVFPGGVKVSLAACRKAVEEGLHIDWFVCNVLPEEAAMVFDRQCEKLTKAVQRRMDKVWDRYCDTELRYWHNEISVAEMARATKRRDEAMEPLDKEERECIAKALLAACREADRIAKAEAKKKEKQRGS